ncbi:sacsin N-terminal ATP-binding-like domain-containing protein [Ferruginibacter sp. SUN106]|uniref:sacsin N-terminal ATP-binding-like domain-containing protein n=1 Tax=Ferruginibacter sp. SUN106 TaxID=2978348 RepID=UPI003D36D892
MPNWFDKSDNEILAVIKKQLEIGDDLIVVGRFVNYKGKDSFINIRNKNFIPLTYVGQGNEHIGQKIKIEIREKHSYILQNEWYEFKIKLGEEGLRKFLNNPTLITIDLSFEPKLFQPKEKEFVLNLYTRKAHQNLESDRNNIQSLRIIEREINRVKEAFIYELLQNADDYPLPNKKVDVKIFTTTNEFIFSHNGSPFKFNNVYALCNINDGDKQDDVDKIGYKGIGFKSVFAYSEKVLVKSGKYIFKFDKKHPEFQREKPFQIIPIWIENLSALKELPIKENVNVVIESKLGKSKIEEWKVLLNDIFSQESSTPVILFLRNIRNVSIDRVLVSQTTREWWIREFKLKLPEEIKSEIKKLFETNTGNIPEKLVGVDEIEIQFSLKHSDYQIIPLSEAILYNYLPTKVNLGFSFLVNSDFIPTGDRHYLFENEWNKYLMKEVGKKFFNWLNTLFTVKHKTTEQIIFKRDYLKLLPGLSKNIQELRSKTSNNLFLLEAFKQGFDLSLLGTETNPAIPFIPTQSGTLEILSNIFIDETGLADLLKEDYFTLTGIKEKLIHNEVGEGIEKIKALITEYEQGVVYGVGDLKTDLKKVEFQEWLKIPSNNFKLIHYFNSKEELQSLIVTEKIILSEGRQLHKSSSLFGRIPEEVTFIPTEKINSELLTLLDENKISLVLREFNAVKFYNKNILGKQKTVNAALTDETDLLNFWKFIFDHWNLFEKEKLITDSLQQFEVLCKPKGGNELLKKVISSAYLSAEFNFANEIESVVKDISTDAVFISEKYIEKKREAEKWKKIFKQAAAITDLQKVIEVLLPKLPAIEVPKHFEITKQIFRFWKDSTNKLSDAQIGLIKTNLKIKCGDNEFRKSTECFISDYYNNNQLISSWLANIELTNQIAQEYAPKTNQIAEWKNFFALIGCVELSDKQHVFDAKLNFFIDLQDQMQARHFELLKSISELHKGKKENGLNFDFENSLSQIKLQTSNAEWHLPNNIHLSNHYKPKLSLQNEEAINSTLHFLCEKYFPTEIEKYFLIEMGVNDSFKFSTTELKRNEIPSQYRQAFERKSNYVVQNAARYANQHRLVNHIDLNYKSLLNEFKYAEIFWSEVKKQNSKHIKYLFGESTYKMAFNSVSFENFVVNYIKQNATLPNQEDKLRKPNELYSFQLIDYITDKNDLQKFDLSEIYFNNDETKSLEDILGIQKQLSQKHCIELLSRTENRLTYEYITKLQLVNILSVYAPSDDEKAGLFLLNKHLEWKPISTLFISIDEQFQIEPDQQLHEVFHSMADNFDIQKLSEDNLVLKTTPKTLTVTEEIGLFFKSKAKFIAFKIDHSNYVEIEMELIEKVTQFRFYEVTSIAMVFPEINPIYKIESGFHFNDAENGVLYKDNWKTNEEIKDFLFRLIQHEKIERLWFENLINRWDDEKIIEKLNEEVGATPKEWNPAQEQEKEEPLSDYLKEVHDFIEGMRKVEDIYDADKIEELKSILATFKNQPEEKKKTFNLLAKLKLCKRLGLNYNNEWGFNKIEEGTNKYFIHSARGSFAYIHPHEIIQMRDNQFKMAIDYGTKDIRIYNSYSEILELYHNYLMLYQGKPSEQEILRICEENQGKGKFHFLIVDREKQTDDALAILKILNTDNYE